MYWNLRRSRAPCFPPLLGLMRISKGWVPSRGVIWNELPWICKKNDDDKSYYFKLSVKGLHLELWLYHAYYAFMSLTDGTAPCRVSKVLLNWIELNFSFQALLASCNIVPHTRIFQIIFQISPLQLTVCVCAHACMCMYVRAWACAC